MLLKVFPCNTSYLHRYKMYSWYSSTITLLLFHCRILFPLRYLKRRPSQKQNNSFHYHFISWRSVSTQARDPCPKQFFHAGTHTWTLKVGTSNQVTGFDLLWEGSECTGTSENWEHLRSPVPHTAMSTKQPILFNTTAKPSKQVGSH